jgi:tetratricopeptide (TPR) repeat protein
MPDRSHNEFLDTLVNGGLVGLALQLTLLALAFSRAAMIGDVWWRAGLLSALVAHTVEIQFGFGTVTSRLSLLAIVAILVGLRQEDRVESPRSLEGKWVILPAVAAAASWWISTWPQRALTLPSAGTADDFITYLNDLAIGSTTLYVVMLVCALTIAWRLSRGAVARQPWLGAAGVAVALIAVVPLSLQPTWADGVTAVGAAFENGNQLAEAAVAYREAIRQAPRWSFYRANLGRVLINTAVQRPAAEQQPLLDEAEAHYRYALAAEPFDPDHYRHLAALLRVRAMTANADGRATALNEGDRLYAEITTRVPMIPSLWVEWGYLELDRDRRASAREKLDRAVALGGNTMTKVKMGELKQLIGQ